MWGFPWLSRATLALLLGLVLLMATDDAARAQLVATTGLVLVVAAIYAVHARSRDRAARSGGAAVGSRGPHGPRSRHEKGRR
jgi:aromatic amino acid permease